MSEKQLKRRMDTPVFLTAYAVFAIATTLFSFATLINEQLRSITVPYTGWIGLFPYSFTLFFAMFGIYYTFLPAVNATLSGVKGVVAAGILDSLLHVFFYMKGTGNFDNPYLTFSPWRPFITILLPLIWWLLLKTEASRTRDDDSSVEVATNKAVHRSPP